MDGSISMDTSKIRIPITEVSDISGSLTGKWVWYNEETAEIASDEWKRNSYVHRKNGISFRMLLEKQRDFDGKMTEYLSMMIQAKMLGNQYLEGIRLNNVERVYRYIMDTGLAKFSFDSFMNAACTDTDIKRDFSNLVGYDLVKYLLKMTNPKIKGRNADPFPKQEPRKGSNPLNMGISWSDRKSRQFMTSPYLKAYWKYGDLKSKSKEFADFYGIQVSEDYWRLELTIKNKEHWKRSGVKDTSLRGLLSLSKDIKSKIMGKAMAAHLGNLTREKGKPEGISPNDLYHYDMIMGFLELGQPIGWIEQRLTKSQTKRDNRSRYKKKVREIYQDYVLKTDKGKEMEKLNVSLENMGFVF